MCEAIEACRTQTHPLSKDDKLECPEQHGRGFGYLVELTFGQVEEDNHFGNDPRVVFGGVSLPSSGLALLAPGIVLGSLVGLSLVGASIAVWRRKGT